MYETNHLKQFEEMFGLLRELVMPGHSTANPTAPNPPATSTSATDKNADETEREKLKRRARIGRDKVINYFGTLKQFIVENELVSSDTNWIPKFRILDAITSYIRNKPALQLPQHVKAQYLIGYEQGKYLGRIVATEFFKTYAHLRTKIAALHNLLDHQFGPLDYSIRASDIYLDQNACQKFMSRHPNLFACLNRHCHASHEDGQSDASVATDSEHKIISDFINSQNLAPVRENINFLFQENVAAVKTVSEKKDLRSFGAKSDAPSPVLVSPLSHHASDTEAAKIIATQTEKSCKKRPTIDEICSKLSAKKAKNT
ncbi:hypothetical protein CAEBREN_22583 [Caenorhabditis brenneri]|uniref:Uncharacterized protein n=1 Tax=Caenorhabditis brenneri TaxID=135651 RepID=G0NSV1_CAEBE|nr:hypothetical protein CAEBREN_22583 [Caenorhabditis brenneri]